MKPIEYNKVNIVNHGFIAVGKDAFHLKNIVEAWCPFQGHQLLTAYLSSYNN
ncbi:MAG: hypothetical protein ACOC6D_04855 [Atribacterota bacterium]